MVCTSRGGPGTDSSSEENWQHVKMCSLGAVKEAGATAHETLA